jgi:hypothetical protein
MPVPEAENNKDFIARYQAVFQAKTSEIGGPNTNRKVTSA